MMSKELLPKKFNHNETSGRWIAAFTIAELLIVIAIIAVLLAIVMGVAPFFGSHTENHDCFGGFLCFLR